MSKIWALVGIAAAVGTGYFLGKKFIENNPETFETVKDNCTETFNKATSAVKSGSEKLSLSVNKIVETGKEKGGEIVKKAKTKGSSFKNELSNLKDMVVSGNKATEVDIYEDEEEIDPGFIYFEEVEEKPEENSEAL